MSVTIILADDHKVVRDGLRALIERLPGMEVIGEAGNGREAVNMVGEKKPDVILMDIGMPDMNGIEATRRIKAAHPEIKVLGLSMYSDRRFILEMLNAGASGYLLKDAAFSELAHAIHAVTSGHMYLCHVIADSVIKDYLNLAAENTTTAFTLLAPREREVLQLIAEGVSTKEIAARMNISVKTVETHRQRVMEKLDIHSIAELTKYALREGLITLDR